MSIRATYLLPAAHYKDQWICFYIQNDGYPAGAADYFHKMHHCKNMSGGYAGRFIRANDKAEFTRSHEAHEDTYFRYTLNTRGELRIWAKGMGCNRWNILYEDFWYNFVNTYLKESEHLHLFQLSKNLQHEAIMTVCEAEKWMTAMTNNASKNAYIREGVRAIQSQLNAILMQQKTSSSNMINRQGDIA